MINSLGRKVAVLVIALGVIAILLGGFFIQQGFAKASYIREKMAEQNITYAGAGGKIEGIIDTPQEAQAMADILTEHAKAIGNYSQMDRNDPNRQTILNAMTMINSLELAVTGSGLTDVVKATGAFMVLTGAAFILIGVPSLRKRDVVA